MTMSKACQRYAGQYLGMRHEHTFCLHYVTFFNLLVTGESASTMDLSLDELIKKNKPKRRRVLTTTITAARTRKKGRETRTIVVGTGKGKNTIEGTTIRETIT